MSAPCSCGAGHWERVPVLHHMPCAYVGPAYDFTATWSGDTCPKCKAEFTTSGHDSEILGYALRCPACKAEWLEEDTQ